ncbi:hypothetical protein ACHAW6_007938 [Cyclotella cf. meneghiniana]
MSSNTSPPPPPSTGHAIRYEVLHLNETALKSARDEFLRQHSQRDTGGEHDDTDTIAKIRHLNIQSMFHRTSLRCLIVSAQEVARREGKEEDVAALEALWDVRSRELEDQLFLPDYVGYSKAFSEKNTQNLKREECEILDAPDDLADGFFQDYPECQRSDDDSSSDVESAEENRNKPAKKKKGTNEEHIEISGSDSTTDLDRRVTPENYLSNPYKKNPPAPKPIQEPINNAKKFFSASDNNQSLTTEAKIPSQSSNGITYHDRNYMVGNTNSDNQFHSNYQQHCPPQKGYDQQGHHFQQPPTNALHPNQWQSRPPTGSFDYSDNNVHIFNDKQSSKQNPFRTAKEVGNNIDDSHNDWDQYEDRNHYYNNQNRKGSRINRNGGWGGNVEEEERIHANNTINNRPAANHSSRPQQLVQTAIRGPKDNISEGLQRKFRPPKLGGNNGNNTNNNSSNSNGGGQTNKHTNRTANNCNAGNDEEVPEELRGLDKELIEKIENEIVDSGEKVTFDDIAGLDNAKSTVYEMVVWPMLRPEMFTGLRAVPNGLLLFGPPGTGKTLIGKAIAHESGATFFSISSSSLTSKWIGEGEKLVRTLFAVARYRSPAVVFIDEVDSMLTARKADENEASRRIKTEFLVQLDGAGNRKEGSHVLVVGATNRPQELDDAARRRFVKRLYVPLPTEKDRETLLRNLLSKNRHVLSEKEIAKLAKDTEGFSGADLKILSTDAAMGPVRQLGQNAMSVSADELPAISYKHFRRSLRSISPSVAQADLDVYLEWNNTYGTKSAVAGDDTESDDESCDEVDH